MPLAMMTMKTQVHGFPISVNFLWVWGSALRPCGPLWSSATTGWREPELSSSEGQGLGRIGDEKAQAIAKLGLTDQWIIAEWGSDEQFKHHEYTIPAIIELSSNLNYLTTVKAQQTAKPLLAAGFAYHKIVEDIKIDVQ